MEKDYFLDRPDEIMYRPNVYNGSQVFICTKKMQPYAKEICDLNLITVTENLTSSYCHSRGQKVKGDEILTDRYGNEVLNAEGEITTKELVGRCTYIVSPDGDGTAVLTKDGYKYLTQYKDGNDLKFKLLEESEIEGKYKLNAMVTLNQEFDIKIPVCKYIYFDDIEHVKRMTKSMKISNIILHNGFITMKLNDREVRFKNLKATYEYNKQIDIKNPEFFGYCVQSFLPLNDSIYDFNKTFELEFVEFTADQY